MFLSDSVWGLRGERRERVRETGGTEERVGGLRMWEARKLKGGKWNVRTIKETSRRKLKNLFLHTCSYVSGSALLAVVAFFNQPDETHRETPQRQSKGRGKNPFKRVKEEMHWLLFFARFKKKCSKKADATGRAVTVS